MKFSMTGPEKMWPFNTGDCLIEVTALAGLTVYTLKWENVHHMELHEILKQKIQLIS